jgi:predicted nuclease of restriction endonuclease-like (RecB) superfamily
MLREVVDLLQEARRGAIRSVNRVMTATYWEIGRRIVEFEQQGSDRARYGAELLKLLAKDLCRQFGRGFGWRNLYWMRAFYLAYPPILQTASAKSRSSSVVGLDPARFWLPWSHYLRLLSVKDDRARKFYEDEALRCGWSIRQLDRQIDSLFFERAVLSRDRAAMLRKETTRRVGQSIVPEEEIKDPVVLEFLDLKDEYSEGDLEEALVRRMESFLIELGSGFAFIGRQRRMRIGDEWFRVDLLFFHRILRCLVVIDLKLGKFTHADAGQMHMYLNFAREHWTLPGENPPIGVVLCSRADASVARYVLTGLPHRILATEYRIELPGEQALAAELERTRRRLEGRAVSRSAARARRSPTG